MPGKAVKNRATDRGPQRWRHRDHNGDNSHHCAAALRRHQGHGHGHERGNHERGTTRLKHTATQQDEEIRCQRRHHRSGEEKSRRDQENLACAEPFDEETGRRNHHGHGQHKAGEQPLCTCGGDTEVCHDRWQRHRQ